MAKRDSNNRLIIPDEMISYINHQEAPTTVLFILTDSKNVLIINQNDFIHFSKVRKYNDVDFSVLGEFIMEEKHSLVLPERVISLFNNAEEYYFSIVYYPLLKNFFLSIHVENQLEHLEKNA